MVAIAEKINNGEKCFHIACDPHITKSPQSSSTGEAQVDYNVEDHHKQPEATLRSRLQLKCMARNPLEDEESIVSTRVSQSDTIQFST